MTKIAHFYKLIIMIFPVIILGACSTNQATGKSQFTAFMPASSESKIGAQEHSKILKEFGGPTKNAKLQSYVQSIGEKLVPHTERKDVKYTFTVLNSPIMNAFALPGGYIYISRGILMYANDEAELASVIGHEIGHVTGQHSAQRYSQSVLAGIGGMAISIATKSTAASQAFGLGSNLYLSSHSRRHESEADNLGIRYINKAGYDVKGSPRFLSTMDRQKSFRAKSAGKEGKSLIPNYLSTHPVTAKRVADAKKTTAQITSKGQANKVKYMQMISGMTYGDTGDQGFIDSGYFVHPKLGFMFRVPQNYHTENSSKSFIAASRQRGGGAVMIFEGDTKKPEQSIMDFARQNIAKGDYSGITISNVTKINRLNTVTVTRKKTQVNKKSSTIKITAIEWDKDTVFTFTQIIPDTTQAAEINTLTASLNSFRQMTSADQSRFKPKTLKIRVVKAGDTVAALSKKLPFRDGLNLDRFRLINGLAPTNRLRVGQLYKTIVQ